MPEKIDKHMFQFMKSTTYNLEFGLGFFTTALLSIYIFIIPRLIDEFNKISSYYNVNGLNILRQDEFIRYFVFLFPFITAVSVCKLLYFGIHPIDFIPLLFLIIHSITLLLLFVLYLFWIVSNRAAYVILINKNTLLEYEQA
ncbi:MAG: hypothetical protein DWP98_12385 [Bacteroidetes bacterium]|nr:MAG: hypothetical protein DWP98_12385 [Bacteroidota bacterium]MBL1145503.1 hypothetical protein [Bacteroidota bacterium]